MEHIVLPGYVYNFKGIPQHMRCTKCGERVADDHGDALPSIRWYVNGFIHERCDKPSTR